MKKRKMGKKHNEVKSRKVSIRRFVKYFSPYLLIMAFVLPALAAEEAIEKLSGGIEKTATAWTEAPKEMAETTEETSNEYMDEHIDGSMNEDVDEEMAEIHKEDETEY